MERDNAACSVDIKHRYNHTYQSANNREITLDLTDKTVDAVYIALSCILFLLAVVMTIVLQRPGTEEARLLRFALNRVRIGLILEGGALLLATLFGHHRLLHSIGCGMGIAGCSIMLMGFADTVYWSRNGRL